MRSANGALTAAAPSPAQAEATRLGLAPKASFGTTWSFDQKPHLSTGLHAALLAAATCERVNLFGFGHDPYAVGGPGRRYFPTGAGRGAGSGGGGAGGWVNHSWRFETTLVRLLKLAGRVNVCTA